MEGQNAGSSMLTEGLPPPPQADGTPDPSLAPADAALAEVRDGPPEWAPAKYWDSKSKSLRIEELGKGYINLEKLVGRDKIPTPLSDDDEDGWNRWYAAAGRPEKPDAYEFKRPDQLPEDLPYDEDAEKNFRTWAHVNGLNKKQANNLYDAYVKTQVERHAAYHTHTKEMRATAEMALRREYGGRYDSALGAAKTVMSQYADPDFIKYLDQTGQGNDPRMIRFLMRLGQDMQGETRLKGKTEPQGSPEDAKKAISEYRTKHDAVLANKGHPDHERIVKEFSRLYEIAYPEMGGM